MPDAFELRGLRVLGVCGTLPEERDRAQPLEVDLDVVADLADDVVVMYGGRVVERGPIDVDEVDELAVCDGCQEVGQRCVREAGLGFRRPAREHPVGARFGEADTRFPDARLADPRLALDEHGRGVIARRDEQ